MYIEGKDNKEVQKIVQTIKKNGKELIEKLELIKSGDIKIETKKEIIEKYKEYLENEKEYREEKLLKNVNQILDEVESKDRGNENGR